MYYSDLLSKHYFPFFLGELKGPLGMSGKTRIQDGTACFVALRTYFQPAKQARQADPASFRPPGEIMRRVYGLQTSGGGRQWNLEVAVANSQRRILPEAQNPGSGETVLHETSRERSNEQDDLDMHPVVSLLKLCQERACLVADLYLD